jgi:hypothetical protein
LAKDALLDQHGIAAQPGKIGLPHQHAAKLGPMLNPIEQIEARALLMFGQQDQARVHAHQVFAVEQSVIVAFAGKMPFEPGVEMIAVKKIQLEMNVGAFLGNAFARVAGPAHDGDFLPGPHGPAHAQAALDFRQMGVERVNLHPADMVQQDDVAAIIGERRFVVDVGHHAIGGGHDRVDGFAGAVALEAFDVQALVHLPAIGADAAEGAGDPGLARGWDKITFLAARFKEGLVGGGKLERLRRKRPRETKQQAKAGIGDSLMQLKRLFVGDDVLEAADNARRFLARGVGTETKDAAGIAPADQHGRQPGRVRGWPGFQFRRCAGNRGLDILHFASLSFVGFFGFFGSLGGL